MTCKHRNVYIHGHSYFISQMVYMMPSAETTEPEDSANEEGAGAENSDNHKSTNGPSSPVNGNARSSDTNYHVWKPGMKTVVGKKWFLSNVVLPFIKKYIWTHVLTV